MTNDVYSLKKQLLDVKKGLMKNEEDLKGMERLELDLSILLQDENIQTQLELADLTKRFKSLKAKVKQA